jgi:DNA polymerase-1
VTALSDAAIDQRPLLLLDGMSLAFRAYFALSNEIATSEGVVTNALHGFGSMLALLIRNHHPRAVVVAFDLTGGTFRDALTDDYKGGRDETPGDLEHQFDLIRNLCESLAIPVVGVPGFEADDVLATYAQWGYDNAIPTIIVTGDRDSFQLVRDPFIQVLYNRRGVSDYSLYDEAGIIERCGVEPARYQLLAALRGDPSDNLPGVPGVGEKTAAKLLSTYVDFDDLFAHLDDLTPKLRENLAANEKLARSNQHIMTLVYDVPLEIDSNALHLGGWDRAQVQSFFERFEMNSMRTRFEKLMDEGLLGEGVGAKAPSTTASSAPAPSQVTVERGETLRDTFAADSSLTIAIDGDRLAAYDSARAVVWVGAREEFARFAGAQRIQISGFNVKVLYRETPSDAVSLLAPYDDGAIMAFLLDAVSGRYEFESVLSRYLNETSERGAASLFDVSSDDELLDRVQSIHRLNTVLRAQIEQWQLDFVYRSIELPLVAVLGWMEARGIYVDRALLEATAHEFAEEVTRLDREIQVVAGHEFKVNSPAQLQKVLFEELGLKPGKKIKSGYSTDATTLEGLANEHPVIPLILRFRELDKLRGTYGQSLIDSIGPDSRIHAIFHQTVARTGRLSSDSPNLHNIPVRTAEGRRLRHAFGPKPGWSLLVADYNQIELRVIAHLSQDPGLLQAFRDEVDVHRSIASIVFSVASADVTHEQREMAKAVSYGLAYGMEAFGLSQRMAISVGDAKSIIDQYFAGFPTLRQYTEDTVREIRNQGFSRTEFGRIRPFPDLATASGPQRQAAERQAMNSGIQGLAADIFKIALVRLDEALRTSSLSGRLVLQVHDEVLVEAPVDEQDAVEKVVRECMTAAATLTVPLDVSVHWGTNWATAKG